MPVVEEAELDCHGRGSRDCDVGVAPVSEVRVAAKIFVADVVAPNVSGLAVDDDDLAVVAEVDLEAIAKVAAGQERTCFHRGFAELAQVSLGKLVRADLIVEKEHLDALASFGNEPRLQLPADLVV